MKWILGLVTLLIFVSCEKSESSNYSLSGNYMGFFSRTGMDTANVSIYFDQDRFQGNIDTPNYPAICAGRFELDNNTISFADSCTWPANFDWSLILSGTYNINVNDGLVRIWKTNGTVTDEYLLRQPVR